MKRTILALCTGLLIFAISGAQAFALECSPAVFDQEGVFSGSELASIESAATQFDTATVFVRTTENYEGFGSLDQLVLQGYVKECPNWQDASGTGMKNNLVVVMFSGAARDVGIFYGDQWSSTLDSAHASVMDDYMVPRFRDGEVAAGIVAGLTRMSQVIDAKIAAPPPSSGTVIVQNEGPAADLTGLWSVLGWVVFLTALFGGVFFVWKLVSSAQKRREEQRAARQKAVIAKQTATAYVNESERKLALFEARVNTLSGSFDAEEYKTFVDKLESVKASFADGASAFSKLAQSSAGNPEDETLSTTEYLDLETAYGNV